MLVVDLEVVVVVVVIGIGLAAPVVVELNGLEVGVLVVVGLAVVVLDVVVVGVVEVAIMLSKQPTLVAKSQGGLAGLNAKPFGQTPVFTLPFEHKMKYLQPSG